MVYSHARFRPSSGEAVSFGGTSFRNSRARSKRFCRGGLRVALLSRLRAGFEKPRTSSPSKIVRRTLAARRQCHPSDSLGIPVFRWGRFPSLSCSTGTHSSRGTAYFVRGSFSPVFRWGRLPSLPSRCRTAYFGRGSFSPVQSPLASGAAPCRGLSIRLRRNVRRNVRRAAEARRDILTVLPARPDADDAGTEPLGGSALSRTGQAWKPAPAMSKPGGLGSPSDRSRTPGANGNPAASLARAEWTSSVSSSAIR
jgi:hypothetical protein